MKNLKKLRLQNHMSQEQLAQQFHITQQTIYKYEAGLSDPDIERLIEFADFFQTSVDYLIGYTDDPRPHQDFIPAQLNSNEQTILACYRQLPLEIRPHILAIMKAFHSSADDSGKKEGD